MIRPVPTVFAASTAFNRRLSVGTVPEIVTAFLSASALTSSLYGTSAASLLIFAVTARSSSSLVILGTAFGSGDLLVSHAATPMTRARTLMVERRRCFCCIVTPSVSGGRQGGR